MLANEGSENWDFLLQVQDFKIASSFASKEAILDIVGNSGQ